MTVGSYCKLEIVWNCARDMKITMTSQNARGVLLRGRPHWDWSNLNRSKTDLRSISVRFVKAFTLVWIDLSSHWSVHTLIDLDTLNWTYTLKFYFRIILRDLYEQKFFTSVHVYLWGWFWNRIKTLHTLSWISVKLSQEYLVYLSWIKSRFQSLWTR